MSSTIDSLIRWNKPQLRIRSSLSLPKGSDVHPVLACEAGLNVISAGWSCRAVPTRNDETFSGLVSSGLGGSSTLLAKFREPTRM